MKREKTIAQWIATISDPVIRMKMYYNIECHSSESKDIRLNRKFPNMHKAIHGMFMWMETPEGTQFWSSIHSHFQNGSGKKSYRDFKYLDKSVK